MAKSPKKTTKATDFSKTLPNNLAWSRSIDVSAGLLFSVLETPKGKELTPVEVTTNTVRGAIASYNAGFDKAGNPFQGEELESSQNPEKPNIQTIQSANLHPESNTLELHFALGVHGANRHPDTCNNQAYIDLVDDFIAKADEAGLYEELAERYVWATVNGSVLWRNGVGINKTTKVIFDYNGVETICEFDTQSLSGKRNIVKFPGLGTLKTADKNNNVEKLVELWSSALKGNGYLSLQVIVSVKMFKGAEVWPSQEFVQNVEKKVGALTKTLSSRPLHVDGRMITQATIHTQKLGNAIRTIDEWHGVDGYGATPVEAFGWVQNNAVAIRTSGRDVYTTLRNLPHLTETLDTDVTSREDALFTLAILVRGGVYVMGSSSTETNTEEGAA